MPQQTSTPGPSVPNRGDAPVRDRGDACPGALRLHRADDGSLARIRIPAGELTPARAAVVADAAERLGDGRIDITSRGNLQLRGLPGGCGGELGALLEAAGLLPSARHERARNIVASPLSGLDGAGRADVRPWARELDALLCASGPAAELSGRFLFACDDGRGDVAALGADVTLLALPDGAALLRAGAGRAALRVAAASAPRAALLAAETFLTVAGERAVPGERATRAWRVRELPPDGTPFLDRLVPVLAGAGVDAEYVPDAAFPSAGARPEPGLVEGPGGVALSVLAPLGRLTSAQWRLLAGLAARAGAAPELRVTPWRGVVVPGAGGPEALREAAEAGLVTRGGSPWLGVGACTGLPGCAKSHRDVRADAARAVDGPNTGPGGGGSRPLPVYWSGCERRCGHPQDGAWVDVTAGETGYTVAVRGSGVSEDAGPRVPAAAVAGAVTAARGR
ncbi:cobalamin biosynthesis protein CobG [Streptomyces sp. HNM0574]|uniref:cobalamin biosynthesis protein CobG n=1 Tax=Streptomyces sp. HNM0574 TaxID=2714954 RepID=UPI001F0F6384|nr:cobalamin biosynthesis protein CobG [Streptomyces sp. HNM0574]